MRSTVVGVDGCKTGWYFVRIDGENFSGGLAPSVPELVEAHRDADVILIDIPIGLRDEGTEPRSCDREARRLLGPRASSVFPAPSRPALSAPDYRTASDLNRQLTGRGLSKQSWAIAPKIREVDDLLRADDGVRVGLREAHPELCFWALAGGWPMDHPKRTDQGAQERYEVLSSVFPDFDRLVVELGAHLPPGVQRDDFLDAASAAVTAVVAKGDLQTIPEETERDAYGLTMEMVYGCFALTEADQAGD